MKRVWAFLLSFVMILSSGSLSVLAADADLQSGQADVGAPAAVGDGYTTISYSRYLKAHQGAPSPQSVITLEASACTVTPTESRKEYADYEGMAGISVYSDETGSLTWRFSVPEEGFYHVLLSYYPIGGTGGAIERSLLIDNAIPFSESESLSFSRIWSNSDEEIKLDTQGNQIMIQQVEKPAWIRQYVTDSSGIAGGPLRYYLSQGEHTLTLKSVLEPMLVKSVQFVPASVSDIPSYDEVSAAYPADHATAQRYVLQAEAADRKSTQMLYPLADQTTPSVVPYSPYQIVYNTIGRNQWTNAGQWAEWDVDIKQDGYYVLSAHYKQSLKDSRSSVRIITIDGEIPFAEAKNWKFPYDSSWKTSSFSDDNRNPYRFYLTAGKHTVRLTVGLGDYADIIAEASALLSELNAVYRSIIAISGASPDQYRDYKFDEMIPGTIEDMVRLSKTLRDLEDKVAKTDRKTGTVPDIKRIYDQLDMMTEDTDTIAVRLSSFKDNIASFGTWINTQRGQPLELDWISLSSADVTVGEDEVGFFALVSHNVKRFFYSFVADYQSIGQTDLDSDRQIRVWMTTSQDQAQLLRQLTSSDFSPESGIAVEVQLVSTKALLPAILAKKGPDVTLGIQQADVNNLAIRNAIKRLSDFSDFDAKTEDFYADSLVPFQWNGGTYALPETLTWPMLFYRKDILGELGVSVKELDTWDSILYSVLPKIKKSSLSFGIMPTIQNYLNFLYQRGGTLYTEDQRNSALSSSEAIESMKLFSILYTQYGFPLTYDFSNRFRTGEMPIAIADFTSYNNLMLFAAEIKGLWGMLPVPGTVGSDGTVNHTAVSTATATVMMADSKDSDSAWEFIKWWTSCDAQNSFGKLLEAVVGTSSRYNTANKHAMAQVRWDPDMRSSMLYQAENLKAYPEVPGGYFTGRLFNFAFRSIVYQGDDVRESMDEVATNIDLEMANKRKEYGIQ